jgi:hypothetical protein
MYSVRLTFSSVRQGYKKKNSAVFIFCKFLLTLEFYFVEVDETKSADCHSNDPH